MIVVVQLPPSDLVCYGHRGPAEWVLWGVRWTQLYLLYTAGVPRQPTRCCGRVVGRRPRRRSLRGWPPSAVGPPRVPRRRRAMWHAHWADSGGWPYGRVGWAAAGVGGRRGCQTGGPARAGPPPREDVRCTGAPRCLSAVPEGQQRCVSVGRPARLSWRGTSGCGPPWGSRPVHPPWAMVSGPTLVEIQMEVYPVITKLVMKYDYNFVSWTEIGTVHCLQAQPDLAGRSPRSCDQERVRRPPSLRSRRHGHR